MSIPEWPNSARIIRHQNDENTRPSCQSSFLQNPLDSAGMTRFLQELGRHCKDLPTGPNTLGPSPLSLVLQPFLLVNFGVSTNPSVMELPQQFCRPPWVLLIPVSEILLFFWHQPWFLIMQEPPSFWSLPTPSPGTNWSLALLLMMPQAFFALLPANIQTWRVCSLPQAAYVFHESC